MDSCLSARFCGVMNRKGRVNLVYYIVIIALLLTSIIIGSFSDYMSANGVTYTFTVVSQIICMLCIPVGMYFLFINRGGKVADFKSDFGFKKFQKGEVIKVIGLGFIAIYLNTIFANINYSFLSLIGYKYTSSASSDYISNIGLLFVDLFMTAMLPAICEETAHRGLFRSAYRYEPVKYILLSSLMFSLMHQNIAQVFYTFCMGLFFSGAVVATDNIKSGMIMHFMINATEVLTDFGVQTNNILFAIKNVIFNLLFMSIVGRILAIVLTFVGIYLFIKIAFSFRKDEYKNFSLKKIPEIRQSGILRKDAFLTVEPTTISRILLYTTIMIGVMCNVFTLTWGLLR